MSTIVIYSQAVQEARNRLRSAQISTMFEVLGSVLFDKGKASGFLLVLKDAIEKLPEPREDKPKAANARMNAQTRIEQSVKGTSVQDLFAVGDALRYVGEYIEFGGAPASVKDFRRELRNKTAFDSANRARELTPDYDLSEWPQLGIFLHHLLDRSVVKYMERCYGPYIGADISGTTTDSLAALAYLEWLYYHDSKAPGPDSGALKVWAEQAERRDELVPIASMVLQYHHSLLECGLALSLIPSNVMQTIDSFKFYDFTTLVSEGNEKSKQILSTGNRTLQADLAGRGLVVIRDAIDIENNPYVDCEIGLLLANDNPLFKLGQDQYQLFRDARQNQIMTSDGFYQKSDPSLLGVSSQMGEGLGLSDIRLNALVRGSSSDLKQWHEESGRSNYMDDLDEALGLRSGAPAQTSKEEATAPAQTLSETKHLSGYTPEQVKTAIAIMEMIKH